MLKYLYLVVNESKIKQEPLLESKHGTAHRRREFTGYSDYCVTVRYVLAVFFSFSRSVDYGI